MIWLNYKEEVEKLLMVKIEDLFIKWDMKNFNVREFKEMVKKLYNILVRLF